VSDPEPDRQNRISDRAYQIWLNAGCPDGKADEHWYEAEREEGDDTDVEVAPEDSFPASDPPSFSWISGPS
jgi:Protein of unknown function (DUF2934)